ncbi:Zinc finger protein 658 [Sarcoptes scabiei]|nr:Zinc finger protein 658 [Sarcoptes scabiei]
MKKIDKTIEAKCREIFCDQKFLVELPQKGLSVESILDKLRVYKTLSKIDFRHGRVSGAIYSNLNDDSTRLFKEIYAETSYTNPLHPDIFPGIAKMEAEVVRMVINLYNGDENCCGSLTSGGTESIILAVKAYRDYGRKIRGIIKPELVLPDTAHAAFHKACQYFNVKLRLIPVDSRTFEANIRAMERAINRNTIALVGSACAFPHGIIDDIQSLAKIGLKHSIPVHVDCCLGGFIVPFVKDAGFPIEPVDFSVKGVTSISCDTHKYGYAPKGSSIIMYSDTKYRIHQYSVQTDWPGGIYASPTIAGSRCGANIATCWASLLHHGYDGYVEATRLILQTQRKLKNELEKISEIFILGDPKLTVIAIGSNEFDIFRLSDLMTEKGWNMNPLQFPSAVHICLTMMHVPENVIEEFIVDLKNSIKICMSEPKKKTTSAGAIYGMAQSIPDRSMVSDIACQYLNAISSTS